MQFTKGNDTEETVELFASYNISHENHSNVIQVYGDKALRGRILGILKT